ncbi:Protein TSSC1 [Hypsibius exemplaris]|uniref:Protein TSSC1 n=1 Tax=Hypsibius exemplaris TaxID=2072580 RepID=A0A1W0WTY1_HYPEX|nr:Protein TSSC1 [Hypsibius exemplaris]
MDEDIPVIYGIDFQARCLVSQAAESDAVRFLIGTQSLKHENQIQLIDFDEESNAISRTVYAHPSGEVWNLSSCPFDARLFATCFNEVENSKVISKASLWQFPDKTAGAPAGDDSHNPATVPPLGKIVDFKDDDPTDTVGVVWESTASQKDVVTLKSNGIVLWDLVEGNSTVAKMKSCIPVEGKGHNRVLSGRWSPHHSNSVIGICTETSIRGIDFRTGKTSYTIENPHGYMVRQLDFNQNKAYDLASCGDDCTAKIWDIRNSAAGPLRVLADHSHWVWCVKYNPFHDQLLLTSSSDSHVILTSIASLSSEPITRDAEDEPSSELDSKENLVDGIINTYEEHEDSVYALDWSSADPWTFASLSYDGRLVINRVPRSVKYRILL